MGGGRERGRHLCPLGRERSQKSESEWWREWREQPDSGGGRGTERHVMSSVCRGFQGTQLHRRGWTAVTCLVDRWLMEIFTMMSCLAYQTHFHG